jgi:hypothetical protein
LTNARIILAPGRALTVPPGAPAWTPDLYRTLAGELAALKTSG